MGVAAQRDELASLAQTLASNAVSRELIAFDEPTVRQQVGPLNMFRTTQRGWAELVPSHVNLTGRQAIPVVPDETIRRVLD